MDTSVITKYKVVPVVVINKLEDTIPILKSLVDGDLPIAEITFRTSCAKEAIKLGVETYPDMLIGAGTVINEEQCKEAIDLGCKFIVGPGFSKSVAQVCIERNIPYYPGCVTPSEMIEAINMGFNIIKFFPASVYGGLKALKSLSGPFPQVKFIPTGGVDASNLVEFLTWDKIHAVGGSWMMKGDIIKNCKDIKEIVSTLN